MKPREFEKWPKIMPVTYGPYRAVIDHCHDADTYLALVDFGMGVYQHREIRLAGASAPENSTPQGRAATGYVEHLLPPGSRVTLRTFKPDGVFSPTLTRWAASVLMEDSRDLATVLVQEGHGRWGSFEG